jgi:sulfide:quinone oxidoreductase
MAGNNTVVILGGGTGGLVAARRLRRLLDPADRVVVVDQAADYLFAPSFLWVMTGTRRPGQVRAERARLRRAGIEIVQAGIHEIDLVPAGEDVGGRDRLRPAGYRARRRPGSRRGARLPRRRA